MKRIIRILIFLYYRIIKKNSIGYHKWQGTKIGENCRIYPFDFSSEPFLIEIGNWVTITSGVRLLTHDGATWLFRDKKGRRHKYQKVIVGNFVFIGIDAIIMPGVKIEDKVIIAAGSVVTKSVPSGVIVAGNSARIIGKYDDYKDKVFRENISDADIDFKLDFEERIMKVYVDSMKKKMK